MLVEVARSADDDVILVRLKIVHLERLASAPLLINYEAIFFVLFEYKDRGCSKSTALAFPLSSSVGYGSEQIVSRREFKQTHTQTRR